MVINIVVKLLFSVYSKMIKSCKSLIFLVPKAGLEPARPLRRGILNPLRLPFRHLGPISFLYEGVKNPRSAKQARHVLF